MFNDVTNEWLKDNIHGPRAACISGIKPVHQKHKLRDKNGQICRMSENQPAELMTMIARYTLPGQTVTSRSCKWCVKRLIPVHVGRGLVRRHRVHLLRRNATWQEMYHL